MRVLKVSALINGQVLLDGNPTTLRELESALSSGDVSVWYYREGADREPTPAQMAVLEAIVRHKAPISLSTKADFSDYVDDAGRPHPR